LPKFLKHVLEKLEQPAQILPSAHEGDLLILQQYAVLYTQLGDL
jgi:hypothetical protein